MVDKKTGKIICTAFCEGKKHDFRLFKESKIRPHKDIKTITDTGYQGIQKLHPNSQLPQKKTKKQPLTTEDKQNNRELAKQRVRNENVIGAIKIWKITADKYRNRRKRFTLRFNLIAAIYNLQNCCFLE